ncbi:MAG: host attachment protein [Alphaproteobacteria bacterium]|nr:host attachment protein [Alphaproteobacteria bacterium]
MKIKHKKTWVVVADGARARIFLIEGPGTGLVPAMDHDLIGNRLPSHEMGSDRSGVSFSSAGPGRRAVAPHTDPHVHAEHEFIRQVATEVRQGLNTHAFEQLVIVAPPKALGELRTELDPQAAKLIKAELNKDLTHLTPHQLAEHLEDILKV